MSDADPQQVSGGDDEERSRDNQIWGHLYREDARKNRRARRVFYGTVPIVLFDVVLTVVLGGLAYIERLQDDRISSVTQQLDATIRKLNEAEGVDRQVALCPLYQIFKNSLTPENRAKHKTPKDLAAYDKAAATIVNTYKQLSCAAYIKNTKP